MRRCHSIPADAIGVREAVDEEMAMSHEDLTREQPLEPSSDRAFGLVFAGVFVIVAGWPLFHAGMPRWWAAGIAVVFAAVSLVKPALLNGLNRLWTAFGLLLGRIVRPIALAIVFYGVMTPLALLMRVAGKDPLRLKLDSGADSYWISREPPGPPPDSMSNQF
jgi:hypothetical protein